MWAVPVAGPVGGAAGAGGAGRAGEPLGVPAAADAGRERVVGNPVRAAYEHVRPVDPDGERAAGGVQLGGAEADPAGPPVQRLGPGPDRHLGVVQRLAAVA